MSLQLVDMLLSILENVLIHNIEYLIEKRSSNDQENVWDHAAGKVVLECAGGIVTDIHGKILDFSHGAKLVENYGIVASTPEKHSIFINQLQSVV